MKVLLDNHFLSTYNIDSGRQAVGGLVAVNIVSQHLSVHVVNVNRTIAVVNADVLDTGSVAYRYFELSNKVRTLARLYCDNVAYCNYLVAAKVVTGFDSYVKQVVVVVVEFLVAAVNDENSPLSVLYLIVANCGALGEISSTHLVDAKALWHVEVELHSAIGCRVVKC